MFRVFLSVHVYLLLIDNHKTCLTESHVCEKLLLFCYNDIYLFIYNVMIQKKIVEWFKYVWESCVHCFISYNYKMTLLLLFFLLFCWPWACVYIYIPGYLYLHLTFKVEPSCRCWRNDEQFSHSIGCWRLCLFRSSEADLNQDGKYCL